MNEERHIESNRLPCSLPSAVTKLCICFYTTYYDKRQGAWHTIYAGHDSARYYRVDIMIAWCTCPLNLMLKLRQYPVT